MNEPPRQPFLSPFIEPFFIHSLYSLQAREDALALKHAAQTAELAALTAERNALLAEIKALRAAGSTQEELTQTVDDELPDLPDDADDNAVESRVAAAVAAASAAAAAAVDAERSKQAEAHRLYQEDMARMAEDLAAARAAAAELVSVKAALEVAKGDNELIRAEMVDQQAQFDRKSAMALAKADAAAAAAAAAVAEKQAKVARRLSIKKLPVEPKVQFDDDANNPFLGSINEIEDPTYEALT